MLRMVEFNIQAQNELVKLQLLKVEILIPCLVRQQFRRQDN
jgi:hypothetical protein